MPHLGVPALQAAEDAQAAMEDALATGREEVQKVGGEGRGRGCGCIWWHS